MVCKRIIYQGHVQGVGFRQTTQMLARSFPITGTVQNLPDGNVELYAEGPDDQVRAFLQALDQRMAKYIQNQTITEMPEQGFQDFHIRF